MESLLSVAASTGVPAVEVPPLAWALLWFYLGLALGVSFLCSLLEASILSLPISHVQVMVRDGKRGGRRLQVMKSNIDRPLAAILTLNTVAHTVGAAGVGAQILAIFGSGAVAIGSVIVTLLILIFSEIIPKSLGAAHPKRLALFTAIAIQGMIWMTLPLLIPLQWLSRRMGGGHAQAVTRDEVAVTAELGRLAGELKPQESRVIRNLLRLQQIAVETVMTPRPVMFALHQDKTVAQVLADTPRLRFTRIPIHAGDTDHITGLVTRPAILVANNSGDSEKTLREFSKPIVEVRDDTSVGDALDSMIKDQQHIFLVTDEFGGTSGLITLEDCIETLLGVEIVDETDSVDDMREVARRLMARRRLQRETDVAF